MVARLIPVSDFGTSRRLAVRIGYASDQNQLFFLVYVGGWEVENRNFNEDGMWRVT